MQKCGLLLEGNSVGGAGDIGGDGSAQDGDGGGCVDSSQPVEEKAGVVTGVESGQIIIDGTAFPYPERLEPILVVARDTVTYYLCDGEIVGIYKQETEIPEEVPDPIPEYRLVASLDTDRVSKEIGQDVNIIFSLYRGDKRVTDWPQPKVSISYSGNTSPIAYEGWEKMWSDTYKLRLRCAAPGTAYLTIQDSYSTVTTQIAIEVGHLNASEFDDESRAEWVSEHIMYACSKTFDEQVVDGFSGTLETALNEVVQDKSIGRYNTLDEVNKLLAFEYEEMTETQEYELLLTQVLFSYNGVTSIEETYTKYLSENIVEIFKVLLDMDEFVSGLDSDTIKKYRTMINAADNMVAGTGELQTELKKLLALATEHDNALPEVCFEELSKNGISFLVGTTVEQMETYCSTVSELVMYAAAGEAYIQTSEDFGEMLLDMRSHLALPSELIDLSPPCITANDLQKMLGREAFNNSIASNPFDCPVSIPDLCRAIENFYTQLEDYRQTGGKKIAAEALSNYFMGTQFDLFSTRTDAVISLFECVPLVKAFSTLRDFFDGTQFVIDTFTGIDEQAYHGTMLMRLYCMTRIHYITVENMADSTTAWGRLPSWPDDKVDRDAQYEIATQFDAAVSFYRALRAVATEYAKAYYATPLLNAPKTYYGRFQLTDPKVAKLTEEQRWLNYEWCHMTVEEYVASSKLKIFIPEDLITYGLKCPINVTVTDPDGTVIAEFIRDQWQIATGYEHYFFVAEMEDGSGEYFKLLTVPKDFQVSFTGTSQGELDAIVTDFQTEASRYFLDIPISEDTNGHFTNTASSQLVVDGQSIAETTQVHVHTYSDAVFHWADDYSCTATMTCTEKDDSKTIYCLVSKETVPNGSPDAGGIVYTASAEIQGKEFTSQKIIPPSEVIWDSGVCGDDLTWVLYRNGLLTISGTGGMYDWMFESIPTPWEEYWRSIRSVIIEEGVTRVGNDAFYELWYLKNVSLPKTLTSIGRYAFSGTGISEIQFSANLSVLEAGAFNATNLTAVTIHADNSIISERAFAECDSLTDVYFSGNAAHIDVDAFGSRIVTIHYPEGNDTWDPDNYHFRWIVKWAEYTPVHFWDKGIVIEEPGEFTEGRIMYTCTECAKVTTEQTPALHVHNLVTTTTVPTCTEEGLRITTCTGCNYVDTTIESMPLDHSFTNYRSDKNATCIKDGTKTAICDRCTLTDTVADTGSATGHIYASTVTPPTCTEAGFVEYMCSICRNPDISYSEVLPAAGHEYVDNLCQNCGVKKISIDPPVLTITNIASTGKIKVTWDKVEGAVKYKVYRATSKTGTYKLMKTVTGTSFTNTSVDAGKTYYYYVLAVDADGNTSEKSNIVSRTCDLPRPEVTLSNVASSGKIKVSWKAIEGAVEYEVYRATSKDGTYKLMKTVTGTSFTNTSTTAGKTYYYKVKAIASKSAADSAYSEVKSRTCDLARPTVSVALSSNKPKVSWKKVDGAVEYEVYRATSKSGTYSKVKTTTSLSYKDTKATSGKTYYYKVIAVASKSAANSAYSSVVSIKSK